MAARADEITAEFYAMLKDELAQHGIRVSPTSGWRSFAEQVAVFRRKGPKLAAKPGKSFHNYGFALDVSIQPQDWATFGRVAEGLGFRWGGRFSRPEPWHVDLGGFMSIDEARTLFDRAFLVGVN